MVLVLAMVLKTEVQKMAKIRLNEGAMALELFRFIGGGGGGGGGGGSGGGARWW